MSLNDLSGKQVLDLATKVLMDAASRNGQAIELGWIATAGLLKPSPEQVEDMRIAYYAGAQHLYSSIMSILDKEQEPTQADMRTMMLIHSELEAMRPAMAERAKRGQAA